MCSHLTNERGSIFAYTAIAMGAFLALTVVGVDVGRLAFTATEVQTVADIAATAGARRLLRNRQTGASDSPVADAQNVVASGGNMLDGQTASIAAADVQVGNYNFQNNTFTDGGTPANAVRANPHKTVNNFVAGILGVPQTTVDKLAIAAMSGPGSGKPRLPLAIDACQFTAYQGSGACSDLPSLNQVPAVGNSCWTSLDETSAGASTMKSYLPTTCCQGGNCGGGLAGPEVYVGSNVNVMNGQADVLLKIIEDCFNQGITEWEVPIIGCGQCTGAMTVQGFATITLDDVVTTGSPKYIDLHAICETGDPGGGGGGGDFGTLDVSLVN